MSRLVSKRLLPQSLLEPAPCKLNWIWNRMLFQEKRITDRHAIHILIVYTSNAGSKDCGWKRKLRNGAKESRQVSNFFFMEHQLLD